VAIVDHLSGGRVEFGTGRSAATSSWAWASIREHARDVEESLRMIPKVWEDGPFSWRAVLERPAA
jgi:alkanesulfonate monooxygenase SsuD/methylene tetrahydromethanopterin reductase-like flavin-dependent oxidoreductase (luciferase family)